LQTHQNAVGYSVKYIHYTIFYKLVY